MGHQFDLEGFAFLYLIGAGAAIQDNTLSNWLFAVFQVQESLSAGYKEACGKASIFAHVMLHFHENLTVTKHLLFRTVCIRFHLQRREQDVSTWVCTTLISM
jgi:hypothetical protein